MGAQSDRVADEEMEQVEEGISQYIMDNRWRMLLLAVGTVGLGIYFLRKKSGWKVLILFQISWIYYLRVVLLTILPLLDLLKPPPLLQPPLWQTALTNTRLVTPLRRPLLLFCKDVLLSQLLVQLLHLVLLNKSGDVRIYELTKPIRRYFIVLTFLYKWGRY